ncbi:MAG: M60 family peptidase N-terminal accessory domain-containing protein [Christensenellales bacterium]
MRSKILTILAIVATLCLSTFLLSACKSVEQSLAYNDDVEARYADGISVVGTADAPTYAVEYQNKARVEQQMYVDNTVKGLHLTGLYLPKGETISVTIGAETAQKSHKIVINSCLSNKETIELNSVRTQYTSTVGGRVDILVDGAVEEKNVFEIKIDGCVRMPFYRLGVEREKPQAEQNGWATLDCGNIRFVFPSEALDDINALDDSLKWWRSAVEAMSRMTGVKYIDGDLSPIMVVVDPSIEGVGGEWNKTEKYVRVGMSGFVGVTDYDNLKVGGGKHLLYMLGNMLADGADGYDEGPLQDKLGKVISNLTYIIMTDNVKGGEGNGIANAYLQLEKAVSGESLESSNIEVFFDGLLHSVGMQKTINALQQYKYTMKQSSAADKWSQYIKDISGDSIEIGGDKVELIGMDLSYYCDWLGMGVSQECKDAMSEKELFVPVQSQYATGVSRDNCQTGISLALGQKTIIDFASSIVSPLPGWKVESVEGNGWVATESGRYEYNPSVERLVDEFQLNLVNGELRTKLYGRVTVDIRVASYQVYRDIAFRDVDKAIKGVADMTPSDAASLSKAQVPEEKEVDDSRYSFGVTKGSLQVKEDGKYTFFLKSKGLVKVNFGVAEYMFEMFNNYLTVSDYTQELKCQLALESDKVYNFEIFVLSTQGGGWATLGIETPYGVQDLGQDNIVYRNMKRSDVVCYESPILPIENIDLHSQVFSDFLSSRWVLTNAIELKENSNDIYLFDDNNATYFEPSNIDNSYVIEWDMQSERGAEYLSLDVKTDMLGANIKVQTASIANQWQDVLVATIDATQTVLEFGKNVNCRYVRLTIDKQTDFVCSIGGVALGKIVDQSRIVPNTSTAISYQGEWKSIEKYASVNGSLAGNVDKNCAMEYEFYGSMIAVYATKDSSFGHAKVYIDGKEHSIVDLSSDVARCGVRVFAQEFETMGLHTIKLVPVDDDKINIDYLTVIEGVRPEQEPAKFNYWLIAIIPAVALMGFIVALIADKISKNRKKAH